MKAEALLALYERVNDAPDAIARLRRFVLDLAVRGKLVEQDASDEPVSELLRRIHQAKSQLINEGRIRRPRDLGLAEETAPKLHVPQSWRWVRLDAVGAIVGGGTPSASDLENFTQPGNGVPWLTPADLGGHRDRYIARGSRDLTEQGLASSSATLMPKGTVLFTSRAPIGYVAIAENALATNQGFKSVVPYLTGLAEFIALVLTAFAPDIDAAAPGTTFKEVSGKIVAGVAFPLPPLAEQHRIVAKVDELMALLDRLEAARSAREATRDRLTTATLARLTAPDTDAQTLPTHARFALDALPALTTRADQIKQIRQTILNLAVRGKLVEQDANDEMVSALLEQRDASQTNEAAFPLPASWAWVELKDVSTSRLGKMLDGAKNKGTPKPYLRNVNVRWFDFDLSDLREMPFEKNELSELSLMQGDVLICEGGEPGRAAVWDCRASDIYFQKALHRVRFCELVDSQYFLHALKASADDGRLADSFTGTGIKHLTGKGLARYKLPLPPLAEQHRIVAKVDELMVLCDRLEAALARADSTRARLLDALLTEALAGPSGSDAVDGESGSFAVHRARQPRHAHTEA